MSLTEDEVQNLLMCVIWEPWKCNLVSNTRSVSEIVKQLSKICEIYFHFFSLYFPGF